MKIMENNNTVMVSVDMITYNHEAYIKQAIEGVLMQKTDIPFELKIGENFSVESTREICIQYKNKYLEIIKLLLSCCTVFSASDNFSVNY